MAAASAVAPARTTSRAARPRLLAPSSSRLSTSRSLPRRRRGAFIYSFTGRFAHAVFSRCSGRRVTVDGQRDLDRIAGQVVAKLAKN